MELVNRGTASMLLQLERLPNLLVSLEFPCFFRHAILKGKGIMHSIAKVIILNVILLPTKYVTRPTKTDQVGANLILRNANFKYLVYHNFAVLDCSLI